MTKCVICEAAATTQLPNKNWVCDEHYKEYKIFKKLGFLEPGFRMVPFSEFSDEEKERALEALKMTDNKEENGDDV